MNIRELSLGIEDYADNIYLLKILKDGKVIGSCPVQFYSNDTLLHLSIIDALISLGVIPPTWGIKHN